MSAARAQVSPPGFDRLYGLELLEVGRESARGRVLVREELKQPLGVVHGGVFAAIAEALASTATARVVAAEGKGAIGLSNQTSFLAPISNGVIDAVALAKHQGRTTWVWEVQMFDDRKRLCALSRVTIAVSHGSGSG